MKAKGLDPGLVDKVDQRALDSLGFMNRKKIAYLIRRISRSRVGVALVLASVVVYGIQLRLVGLDRSLYLDEAWVANAATSESLSGVLFYESWLQTSPPLFLLLVRATVDALGVTSTTLRLVPLVFSFLSAALMFLLAREVLSARLSILAWTLFTLSPLATSYARILKQYSGELAISTLLLLLGVVYLKRPTALRYRVLVGAATLSVFASYSAAFIAAGIALAVALQPHRIDDRPAVLASEERSGFARGFIFAAWVAGLMGLIYIALVLPNVSPDLRRFWWDEHRPMSLAQNALTDYYGLLSQLPVSLLFSDRRRLIVTAMTGLCLLAGLVLACIRLAKGRRMWLQIQVACWVPILLLTACGRLSLYPTANRMRLFLLPAFLLILFGSLELTTRYLYLVYSRSLKPILDIGALSAALVVVVIVARVPTAPLAMPTEDVASAVNFLRSRVRSHDVLWVHASTSEAFKLYARITNWSDVSPRFGSTGWPCCPRGSRAIKGAGSEAGVRKDLDRGIPVDFAGTVWLLYTTRSGHWRFVGTDESLIMNKVLRERGCVEKPTPLFHNIGIGQFDCHASRS